MGRGMRRVHVMLIACESRPPTLSRAIVSPYPDDTYVSAHISPKTHAALAK
jgi:hypothetical protein